MDPILGLRYPITVPDTQITVTGSADATKLMKFEVDTQATGFTFTWDIGAQTGSRTLTVPVLAGADTIMTLATAQTVSGAKTFSAVTTVSNTTAASSSTVGSAVIGNGSAATSIAMGAGKYIGGDSLSAAANIDSDNALGRCRMGLVASGTAGYAYWSHYSAFAGSSYALAQGSAGDTYFNCAAGQFLNFNVGGSNKLTMDGSTTTLSSSNTIASLNATDATSSTSASVVLTGGLAWGLTKTAIGGGSRMISPTIGIGYGTGAGGTVTQATSRATGVTLSKVCGQITLFTAAGSATPATFVVTNTAVAATDTIAINDVSGSTNVYWWKATPAAGSFTVTFWTTGGVASDTPVISFSVTKAVTA